MATQTAPIPTIDFSAFSSDDAAARKKLAQDVDKAFQTSGFLQLTNHSLPQALIDEAFAWSARFFALPQDVKMLAPHPPGGSHHRGYSGLGVEKVSQHIFDRAALAELRGKSPDVKESFESGNPADTELQPNIWLPEEELPGFREFCERFFAQASTLVRQVLTCLELALALPEDKSLVAAHKTELYQLRLLHYPPVQREILDTGDASRISAHSDFGTLTLLWQDAVGGLEVEDPDNRGVFRAVAPIPGAVVVNVADCLERWSNGRWRSCVHRVVAPPLQSEIANGSNGSNGNGVDGSNGNSEKADQLTAARYSIPFFAGADPGAVVEALPGCFDEKNPKKYEPITALDYILKRMEALY